MNIVLTLKFGSKICIHNIVCHWLKGSLLERATCILCPESRSDNLTDFALIICGNLTEYRVSLNRSLKVNQYCMSIAIDAILMPQTRAIVPHHQVPVKKGITKIESSGGIERSSVYRRECLALPQCEYAGRPLHYWFILRKHK
jgi:hypothetical protein